MCVKENKSECLLHIHSSKGLYMHRHEPDVVCILTGEGVHLAASQVFVHTGRQVPVWWPVWVYVSSDKRVCSH